jgi:hypothetical protein
MDIFNTLADITRPNDEQNKAQRIEELKELMRIEQENKFPNGDLWNDLSDELDELERVPDTLTLLMMIMNSPKE